MTSHAQKARGQATHGMSDDTVRELLLGGDPEVFRWEDDDIALRAAAANSRLPWDQLTAQEKEVFSEVETDPALKSMYLFVRNKILQMWLLECNVEVVVDTVANEMPYPYNTNHHLLRRVHAFLTRYGYINYGKYYRTTRVQLPSSCKKRRILVIGAGVAGLAAFRQLKNFGFDPIIIEARNRVGGRVHTFKAPHAVGELGASNIMGIMGNPLIVLARQCNSTLLRISEQERLYAENGEEVPIEVENVASDLYNKLGATAGYIGHVKNITKVNKEALSLEDMFKHLMDLIDLRQSRRHQQYWEIYEEVLSKKKQLQDEMALLKKCADTSHLNYIQLMDKAKQGKRTAEDELEHDIMIKCFKKDVADAVKKFDECQKKLRNVDGKLSNLKQMENKELVINSNHKRIMDHNFAHLENSAGTNLRNLSLLHWDHDDPFEMKGSQMTVKEGMSTLFDNYCTLDSLHLNICVEEIAYDQNGVTVTAKYESENEDDPKNGEPRVFKGDAVVCTLPLGVLKKSIEGSADAPIFDPPLPFEKTRTIKHLGFGAVNKLGLVFDKPFWDMDGPGSFGQIGKTSGSRGEFFSFFSSNDSPCLVGLLAGDAAGLTSSAPIPTLTTNAMAMLTKIFGSGVPKEPSMVCCSRWETDKHTFGAFSYIGKNSDPSMYNVLSEPVRYEDADAKDQSAERIFFAGEHTSRNYPATVHGAYLSGLREAARIADLFVGRPFMHNYVPECVTLSDEEDEEEEDVKPKVESANSQSTPLRVKKEETAERDAEEDYVQMEEVAAAGASGGSGGSDDVIMFETAVDLE